MLRKYEKTAMPVEKHYPPTIKTLFDPVIQQINEVVTSHAKYYQPAQSSLIFKNNRGNFGYIKSFRSFALRFEQLWI